MGYYDHTPSAPSAPSTPKVNQTGGGNSSQSSSKSSNAAAAKPDPSAPAPGGYDIGPVHFGFNNAGAPGMSWQGGGLGGWMPSSQRLHDFSNRLMNNFLLNTGDPIVSGLGGGDLPTLRVQRAQANQRMPTSDKVAADYIGQFNPSMFLRSIPAVGPIAQGAVQEAVKGYAQGEQWPQIARDAAVGTAGGVGSNMTSTPGALGTTLGKGVTAGVPAAVGWLYGGKTDDVLQGMGGPAGAAGGALVGNQLLDPWAKSIEKSVSDYTPGWMSNLGSYAPLAGASYFNQQQRDRATLAGQQP